MEKMADSKRSFSRRTIAFFWCLLVVVGLATLIYFEQIALLYVLTTAGLVALLLIVGFADLERVGRENIEGISQKTE